MVRGVVSWSRDSQVNGVRVSVVSNVLILDSLWVSVPQLVYLGLQVDYCCFEVQYSAFHALEHFHHEGTVVLYFYNNVDDFSGQVLVDCSIGDHLVHNFLVFSAAFVGVGKLVFVGLMFRVQGSGDLLFSSSLISLSSWSEPF